MTLEDDVKPICVEGIELETAMERAHELSIYNKAEYRNYKLLRIIPPMYAALAGFSISTMNIVGIAGGLVLIAGAILVERKNIRNIQKEAVNLIAYDCWEKHRKI